MDALQRLIQDRFKAEKLLNSVIYKQIARSSWNIKTTCSVGINKIPFYNIKVNGYYANFAWNRTQRFAIVPVYQTGLKFIL